MILKDMFSVQEFVALARTAINNDEIEVLFTSVYYKNFSREVKDMFSKVDVSAFIVSYLGSNFKKFEYLLKSMSEDFIGIEKTATQSASQIQYNIDFEGGEGQRDKNLGDASITETTVNKRQYLSEFKPVEHNILIIEMLNTFLVSMVSNEDWWREN